MTLDLPGFADPVRDAQTCFRAVLEAMSRPGRIVTVGGDLRAPPPLLPAAAAVLLTLADMSARIFLPAAFAPAADWLRFHCGSEILPAPAGADFAVVADLSTFSLFGAGTDEAPEESATIVVQVATLGSGRAFVLRGPGIRSADTLRVCGLPEDFPALWAANRQQYPRGVDVLLASGTSLAALPRSVTLEAG